MSGRSHDVWFDHAPLRRVAGAARGSGLFRAGMPVTFARAPGRLDVMGGIADYSGSLVCEMPLAVAAAVAVQARDDGKVVMQSAQESRAVTVELSAVAVFDPLAVRGLFAEGDAWARYVAGCVWWLMKNAKPQASPGSSNSGVTIYVDSDVPLGGGVSSSAAIEVATMTALAALWGVTMQPMQVAAACQVVENSVVGAPCGVMDQVTSCLGRDGDMLEILCQEDLATRMPARVIGPVRVPEGYTFIGIHSGVRHEVKGDPYTDTRVAAFMAQKILEHDTHNACLANVDIGRFRGEWREKLPATMNGGDFLQRHGGTNDPVTTVQPDRTYSVRAAADHHVLEMSRVGHFVALIKTATERAMTEAGLLMYESHDSYGRCANLGHAMTDKLVEMVRALGPAGGFYGAKITGGGCGGTVAVLMRDTAECRAAVADLRKRYERETGRTTMYFEGTSPGAAAKGTRTLRWEELP